MVALTQGMIDALDNLDAAKPTHSALARAMHAFDYANRKRGSHIADGLNRMQDLVDGPIAEMLAERDASITQALTDPENQPSQWGTVPMAILAAKDAEIVALWKLLDDIDTLDDACKSDDLAFRNHAYAIQRKRFDIVSGEKIDAISALAGDATAPATDR